MYTYITSKDSRNSTPASQSKATFGYDRVIEGITLHWWGDPNQNPQFDSVVNYLCRNGGNSSAHYVATGTGRKVACIVSPLDVAWHSGSAWGNARTIGIELDPRARAEDVDVAAELVADIRSAFGDVPIYWHSLFQATQCPGTYRDSGLIEKIDELSYKKISHADWGAVTDVQPKTPAPAPAPVEVSEPPKKPDPSPTTNGSDGEPLIDSGLPVAEKVDYSKENNSLLKTILELLTALITKVTNIFK